MPQGIVIMNWDDRIGAQIIGQYPRDIDVTERTLMQLYAQHEYLGDAGSVSLTIGSINLVSFYSGPQTKLYAILVLDPDEDGFEYEEALGDVVNQAAELKDNMDNLVSMIPNYYQRVKAYPTLTMEQKMGLFYLDEVQRMILDRFRKEMYISQSEIQIWVKDKYRGSVAIDVDTIIEKMIKMGLIKRASIKGEASDLLFFVRDIMMIRKPPTELVKDPVEHHLPRTLKKVYVDQVLKFFNEYKRSEEDLLQVIQILLEPDVYEVFKLLRIAILTKNDIEKLKKKGVDDSRKVLKKLWDAKMITVLEDKKKTEYYALISDFFIGQYYPSYNLDTIVTHYQAGSRTHTSLIRALGIMKEEYFIQYPKSKKKAIKAKAAHT